MKPEFNLKTPVQFLKSVGPARARGLARLGIDTVGDLMVHYPLRYFDRTATVPMGRIPLGRQVTVLGEVLTLGERRTRGGRSVQTVTLGDDTGILFCVWFNQSYLLKQFRPGQKVMASGLVQRHNNRTQMAHPDYEVMVADNNGDEPGLHTGRLVPVYGLTAGIGQHWLRALVFQALERLEEKVVDPLPAHLVKLRGLCPAKDVLAGIHFPEDRSVLEAARARIKYEEGFFLQLLMKLRRGDYRDQVGVPLGKPGDLTKRMVDALPFDLTGAQRRVLSEILADLRCGRVMHRLVQGDVGCGKTLVAFIACLFVIEQGYQAIMMAPTEVLARQHGQTLTDWASPLGKAVEVLTGSTPAAERRRILAAVASGEVDLLVGTHAVIQADVRIPRLALSVIDEQHRFGVRQRSQSAHGSEVTTHSHILVMSATPIPRSLALTVFGDLDLSLIDERPSGRGSIRTEIVQSADESRVWQSCRQEVEAGRQVFVVHPVIDETEGQDLKSATVEYERLLRDVFPEWKVALLHGRMKAGEKQKVMAGFSSGEIQVLVATTVVEVGLDVPNATVMIIQNPERFGLAQLHQLRGRVGRGKHPSTCWLLCDRFLAGETFERIGFFAANQDGFTLAEQDLRTRGPGEAWGTRQHGAPGFRLLNPISDSDLIEICRQDSHDFLESNPGLKGPSGRLMRETLGTLYGRQLDSMSG
jgi:ATP-dependent DNA helicase RecG